MALCIFVSVIIAVTGVVVVGGERFVRVIGLYVSLVLRGSRESGVAPYVYSAVVGCVSLCSLSLPSLLSPVIVIGVVFAWRTWRWVGFWLGSAASQRYPGDLSAAAGVAAVTSARPLDRPRGNRGGATDAAPLKNTVRTVKNMVF